MQLRRDRHGNHDLETGIFFNRAFPKGGFSLFAGGCDYREVAAVHAGIRSAESRLEADEVSAVARPRGAPSSMIKRLVLGFCWHALGVLNLRSQGFQPPFTPLLPVDRRNAPPSPPSSRDRAAEGFPDRLSSLIPTSHLHHLPCVLMAAGMIYRLV